jgi:hypothetical protein
MPKNPEEQDLFDEKVYRLKEKGMTHEAIAAELGCSPKSVQRANKRNEDKGRLLKRQIPTSQEKRDEIFEEHLDTFMVMRAAIRRTERLQEALEAEMGFTGSEPCECCGRWPLKATDALKWQAAFKGGESLNAQVTTLAKMLGQLSDTAIIMINQIDEDSMLIMEELAKLDKPAAHAIYNRLIERSQRRRHRLPDFTDVIEGDYKLLPMGE